MKTTRNILIVEDDKLMAGYLARLVERMGLNALVAGNVEQGFHHLVNEVVHLAILDLSLGRGPNGLAICRAIKADVRTRTIPVIIFTGASAEKYNSIEHGADCYLQKGALDDEEIIKHVAAYLNRKPYKNEIKGIMIFKGIVLDPKTSSLSIGGRTYVGLPSMQFEFLIQLAAFQGKPTTRRYLAGKISSRPMKSRHVDVLVSRLKKRLDPADAARIACVRDVGYHFTSPSD